MQEKKIKKLAKLVQRSIAAAKKSSSTSSTKPNGAIPREITVEDDDNDEDFHHSMESGSRGSVKAANDGDENENHLGRVSRMKMEVNLHYHDKITQELREKTVHAEYTGPVVNSKPHGPGMLKFACGDVYLGMFEDGMMSGTGSYVRNKKRRHHTEKGSKVPKHITTTSRSISDDDDKNNKKKEQQDQTPVLTKKKRSYFKGVFNHNEFVHEEGGTKK
jgi:hypothetical protein